jgi:hypothetical protein
MEVSVRWVLVGSFVVLLLTACDSAKDGAAPTPSRVDVIEGDEMPVADSQVGASEVPDRAVDATLAADLPADISRRESQRDYPAAATAALAVARRELALIRASAELDRPKDHNLQATTVARQQHAAAVAMWRRQWLIFNRCGSNPAGTDCTLLSKLQCRVQRRDITLRGWGCIVTDVAVSLRNLPVPGTRSGRGAYGEYAIACGIDAPGRPEYVGLLFKKKATSLRPGDVVRFNFFTATAGPKAKYPDLLALIGLHREECHATPGDFTVLHRAP